MQEVFQAEGN